MYTIVTVLSFICIDVKKINSTILKPYTVCVNTLVLLTNPTLILKIILLLLKILLLLDG